MFFFFFQAEDGIRDKLVTGVQTCALPIYPSMKYCRTMAAAAAAAGVAIVRQYFMEGWYPSGRPVLADAMTPSAEIGRASCRERGEISVVAGSLKKKKANEIASRTL